MIETLLLALILSKFKHYKLKYLFYEWSFYPIFVTQCILIFFQISVFCGSYYFVQFASAINTTITLSFIFPLLVFNLYKPAIIGSCSIVFGTILNKIAITQNGGKMPVFPTLSYITGYAKTGFFGVADSLHILGGDMTRFKILTDYIDLGYSILSIGDVFIHFFTFLMFYYTIKAVNIRHSS